MDANGGFERMLMVVLLKKSFFSYMFSSFPSEQVQGLFFFELTIN
jgi:hypothetical protein